MESITNTVDRILSITTSPDYLSSNTKRSQVLELENKVDQLVYKLYDLSSKEIQIVEKS
jgi:hypothetical protein